MVSRVVNLHDVSIRQLHGSKSLDGCDRVGQLVIQRVDEIDAEMAERTDVNPAGSTEDGLNSASVTVSASVSFKSWV